MSDETEYGEALATIAASRYRKETLTALIDGPKAPKAIGNATELDMSHVSRALRELREIDCVELLVPEETKKGRVYGATDLGEDVMGDVPEE